MDEVVNPPFGADEEEELVARYLCERVGESPDEVIELEYGPVKTGPRWLLYRGLASDALAAVRHCDFVRRFPGRTIMAHGKVIVAGVES